MASSNPRRRTPVTRADAEPGKALTLKTGGLRKGVTFHSPTSPTFSPPALARAQTNLDDVVGAHVRRMAMIVDNIDKSLNLDDGCEKPSPSSFRDDSLPVPRGFLNPPVVDPAKDKENKANMERRVLRPRHRRSSGNHESDSGLGTSLASTTEATVTSKEKKASAITRSAASSTSTTEKLPGLSSKAVNRIHEHVLRPLRAKPNLKDFEPIVLDVPRRIREKEIVCLRDLEKTLIFMAPERTKTAGLYLEFCLTSIRCIQATVEYLSDREQTRPNDRPYTNGYFIDLVEQINQYAGQLANAKDGDEMDLDKSDEVKLFGGITENGRPAELVRIRKDGKAFSMATGLLVDMDEDTKGPIKLKRSLSQQIEDDEEILRSMARRKKNATPEELAPKKCREPGCNKEFKRPCDLTKHEKTHSRPWKCPVTTCKYHEYGWPTEKEMDRHHNDKHSSAPPMYECLFKPCPYKSKRESNCKQHMEKAHNWTYVRTKSNGKKPGSKDDSSAQPTPQLGNMPTPSSNQSIATPPEEHINTFVPFNGGNQIDFPAYMSNEEFNESYLSAIDQQQQLMMDDLPLEFSPDHNTPSATTDSSYGQYAGYQDGPEFTVNEDIYSAHAQLPTPVWQTSGKMLAELQNYQGMTVCEQQPAHPHQAPHISPIGEGNAMLFTPNSLAEVDEGFEDLPPSGGDFQLFSSNSMTKAQPFDSLFGDVPSTGLGFSQTASQDLFNANMDWSNMDFPGYHQ